MLSKLFFQKIIPIVACAISCNAFSALESKAERFSGFASVELRDYQISIPSGYYEFRVSSPNGDPTVVFFTADMEELGFSSTYGSEILKGNLAEGTYVLRIATESCSAWVSNCDIDVGIYGSNNQLLNIGMTEIWRAVRPRSSPAQSTTVPSHCRHYWYRVTGCPTPSSADWPDEWQ